MPHVDFVCFPFLYILFTKFDPRKVENDLFALVFSAFIETALFCITAVARHVLFSKSALFRSQNGANWCTKWYKHLLLDLIIFGELLSPAWDPIWASLSSCWLLRSCPFGLLDRFGLPLGFLWVPFAPPWRPPGPPWSYLGLPLSSLEPPLVPIWSTLALLGSPWMPYGIHLAPS